MLPSSHLTALFTTYYERSATKLNYKFYKLDYISSFPGAVIEVLGWKGNCTRLTQLQVEWESDEYLELDLFFGKKRECWDEQNKFMFLTSLSTKTQIGTFFSLCFVPTKENVFGKFCITSPSFPLNINTFCLSFKCNAGSKTTAIRRYFGQKSQ